MTPNHTPRQQGSILNCRVVPGAHTQFEHSLPPLRCARAICRLQATGCTGNQAEALVKSLSDSGRYLKDVW